MGMNPYFAQATLNFGMHNHLVTAMARYSSGYKSGESNNVVTVNPGVEFAVATV